MPERVHADHRPVKGKFPVIRANFSNRRHNSTFNLIAKLLGKPGSEAVMY